MIWPQDVRQFLNRHRLEILRITRSMTILLSLDIVEEGRHDSSIDWFRKIASVTWHFLFYDFILFFLFISPYASVEFYYFDVACYQVDDRMLKIIEIYARYGFDLCSTTSILAFRLWLELSTTTASTCKASARTKEGSTNAQREIAVNHWQQRIKPRGLRKLWERKCQVSHFSEINLVRSFC